MPSEESVVLWARDRERAAGACRFIAIGLLVIFIDIRLNGFDIVLDVVGAALIVAGARTMDQLMGLHEPRLNTWVQGGAICGLIQSVLVWMVHAHPVLEAFNTFLGLASVAGTVAFALLMQRTCRRFEDVEPVTWWRLAYHFVLWLWFVPLLCATLTRIALSQESGVRWHVDLGAGAAAAGPMMGLGLLIMGLLLVPFVVLQVALWRTASRWSDRLKQPTERFSDREMS